MSDLSHPFTGPYCASCTEVHIRPGDTANLLPAYPMLIFVTYGSLRAGQAGQDLTIESGSCALFKPGEAVTLRAANKVPLTLIYAELAKMDDMLLKSHRLPLILTGIDTARTHDYLKQLLAFQVQDTKDEPHREYEDAILANGLILLLIQALKQEAAVLQPTTASQKLQKIRAYCLRNLAGKITIADLQKLFSISAAPLYELVKKAAGMSPMAYIRQIRFDHALQLLSSSQKSVKEIAEECGYPSPFQFSRIFKKRYGISPSAYREQACDKSPSRGDILMRRQKYTEAINAYQEQLKAEHNSFTVNEIRYNLGRAFYCTEQYEDAIHMWQRIRDTPYWLKAVPDILDILFRSGRFEEGGQLFRNHYDEAAETGVQKGFHAVWLRWVHTSRLHRDHAPLEMLFSIREELFPEDLETAYEAGRHLMEAGRSGKVIPGQPFYANSLRVSGHYQEIVDSPDFTRKDKAKALLSSGKYQTIIDEYRDFEHIYATALGLLGKAETGLREFAADSQAYAISLFYNGEYDRIISDYRQFKGLCCDACYMKNEPEKIITLQLADFWQARGALCLLGRTSEARGPLQRHSWKDESFTTIIEAVQMLLQGNQSGAEKALIPITQTGYSSPSLCLSAIPAYLILAHLQKDTSALTGLEKTVKNKDYEYQQGRQWFCARHIIGDIDDKAYLHQPRQHPDPQKSLPLFQAVRADLAGNTTEAIEKYTIIFDRYSQNMLYFEGYAGWHWYIKWRLQELGAMPK